VNVKVDAVPLIVGGLVFLSSIISLRAGLSVAIIESYWRRSGLLWSSGGRLDVVYCRFWRNCPYFSRRVGN